MPRHADFDQLEQDWGVVLLPTVEQYVNPKWRKNYRMAMDALMAMDAQQGTITVANAGIPAFLTTMVDPEVIRVALAPLAAAKAFGETKRGDWTKDTIMFNMVEMTGEVSSYGDFNNNGRASANVQWPQRQSYHFQVIIEYGERELDRAAEAKLNWVQEQQTAAANALNRYQNLTYHNGVSGLQNYGTLNDPTLPATLTPSTKAAGGTRWITTGGVPNATANEVLNDFQSMFYDMVTRGNGVIERDTPMTVLMSPQMEVGTTFTNSYGVSVADLLTKNFPNVKIVTDPLMATGAGQLVQMFADKVEGIDSVLCAFTEKLRQHPLIKELSAFKQKNTSGTWGSVMRFPVAISQLLGV